MAAPREEIPATGHTIQSPHNYKHGYRAPSAIVGKQKVAGKEPQAANSTPIFGARYFECNIWPFAQADSFFGTPSNQPDFKID